MNFKHSTLTVYHHWVFFLSTRKTAKKSWTLFLVLLSIMIWVPYRSYFVCTLEKRKWVNISMLLGTYVFIVRNVLVRNEWRCMDGIVAISVSFWLVYIYISAWDSAAPPRSWGASRRSPPPRSAASSAGASGCRPSLLQRCEDYALWMAARALEWKQRKQTEREAESGERVEWGAATRESGKGEGGEKKERWGPKKGEGKRFRVCFGQALRFLPCFTGGAGYQVWAIKLLPQSSRGELRRCSWATCYHSLGAF